MRGIRISSLGLACFTYLVPVAGTASADQQPAPVTGSGTATLTAPKGCVGKHARLTVHGTAIANVSYYLDSQKLWTVIEPDAHGRFSYTTNTSKLKAGVHRVRAQVTYKAASSTASQTLAAEVRRCAMRATPRFTG